jgi:hypothetical protein
MSYVFVSCLSLAPKVGDLPKTSCCFRDGRVHMVHGRVIYSTKVTALPESLGKCKLLEELCVRAARCLARVAVPMPVTGCCGRWAAPMPALGRAQGRCAAVAARPVAGLPSHARARGGAAPGRRGPLRAEAARRSHCGVQVSAEHRARGAADGGRLALPS